MINQILIKMYHMKYQNRFTIAFIVYTYLNFPKYESDKIAPNSGEK